MVSVFIIRRLTRLKEIINVGDWSNDLPWASVKWKNLLSEARGQRIVVVCRAGPEFPGEYGASW